MQSDERGHFYRLLFLRFIPFQDILHVSLKGLSPKHGEYEFFLKFG